MRTLLRETSVSFLSSWLLVLGRAFCRPGVLACPAALPRFKEINQTTENHIQLELQFFCFRWAFRHAFPTTLSICQSAAKKCLFGFMHGIRTVRFLEFLYILIPDPELPFTDLGEIS